MKSDNSAIELQWVPLSSGSSAIAMTPAPPATAVPSAKPTGSGLWWGLLGVAVFSLTVPLTRIAVVELAPMVIAAGRAVVAGILAVLVLVATRSRFPTGGQALRLLVVAAGVVVGFPLLTSLALRDVPAVHAAVITGLPPATTAVLAVLRGRERPSRTFWVAAAAGAVAVLGFTVSAGGGLGRPQPADLLLLAAMGLAAMGYSEGAVLSWEIGSWQVICWALVLALPVTIAGTAWTLAGTWPHASAGAWASFAYLGVFSMFLGFFAWYRGLAIGPVTTVSQVQLVQPVMSIGWAVVLLGEQVTASIVLGALAVIGCAGWAVRARVRTR